MLAVDENGAVVDGDHIVAILAPHLGVDLVAVTVMSNLGLHSVCSTSAASASITTPVGDRYVLEALREHGGILGGEQSGHIIYLRDHVTGDGLAAALLLCDAIRGRTLSEAAAEMPTFPQVKENLPLQGTLPAGLLDEVRTAQRGARRHRACPRARPRAPSRSSGSSPRRRTEAEARRLSDTIAALVRRELG